MKRYLYLILFGFLIFSCSENEKSYLNDSFIQDENFVTIEMVNEIGTVLEYPTKSRDSQKTGTNKKIESITEISDELGIAVYYIVNYECGGFIILSADNRIDPLLAYSETNTFPVNSDYPKGLSDWLENTKNKIKRVRESKSKQTPEIEVRWDELLGKTAPLPDDEYPPDDDGESSCEDTHYHVEPLLSTLWWQGGGFNDSIPEECEYGEEALVGCGAVAMAQVMRFHEYPDNYNWDIMPNLIASSETARLMRDIGYGVNMDWGCDESGTGIFDMESGFKNYFGYTSVVAAEYNRYIVENELKLGRPVILTGQDIGGGHAWVCEGYVRSYYCNGTSYLSFYMNWGWEFGRYNGYFTYSDWTPGDADYNNGRGMITNIKP